VCVGWGSSGEVMKGLWRGSEIAVKTFHDLPSPVLISDFKAEVTTMSRLVHPNIVQLYGFVSQPGNLAIVSEFVPCGSLFDLLHGKTDIFVKRREAIDSQRWLMMALDIARGMDYLHSCNPAIVHRDLKSPNLLINRSCQVKVSYCLDGADSFSDL
jgi:sterile alpha motif and leucine zipper-containing kinase AZK